MPKYSLQTSDRLCQLSNELRCIAFFRYLCSEYTFLPAAGFPEDMPTDCEVLLQDLETSRLNELCTIAGGDPVLPVSVLQFPEEPVAAG